MATICGSKEPSRSRGVRTSTGPRSVATVLLVAPFRTFEAPGVAPGGRPRCSVSSACNAASRTRPASLDNKPPGPVSSSGLRPSTAPSRAPSGSSSARRSTTSSGARSSFSTPVPGRRLDCMELMVMVLLPGRPPRRPGRSPPPRAPGPAGATASSVIDHHDHTHFTGQTRRKRKDVRRRAYLRAATAAVNEQRAWYRPPSPRGRDGCDSPLPSGFRSWRRTLSRNVGAPRNGTREGLMGADGAYGERVT